MRYSGSFHRRQESYKKGKKEKEIMEYRIYRNKIIEGKKEEKHVRSGCSWKFLTL